MTDPIVLASVYRMTGVNFRLAAETLAASMDLTDDGLPAKFSAIPFYFLVSHSAELFLKSALLKRGYVEGDLKKFDFRHNLNSLLQAVQDKGVMFTPETVALIDGLHEQHQTHSLRYTALLDDGQPVYMPQPSRVFGMLDELLMLTRIATQGV